MVDGQTSQFIERPKHRSIGHQISDLSLNKLITVRKNTNKLTTQNTHDAPRDGIIHLQIHAKNLLSQTKIRVTFYSIWPGSYKNCGKETPADGELKLSDDRAGKETGV